MSGTWPAHWRHGPHDVTLLGFATGEEEPGETMSEGVRLVRVRTAASRVAALYSDPTRPHALPLPDPVVSRAIRHELSAGRFDVVHAHNWIVNSALGPAASAKVPLVMTLHDYSHICVTKRLMEHGRQQVPGTVPGALPVLRVCALRHGQRRGHARRQRVVGAAPGETHRRRRGRQQCGRRGGRDPGEPLAAQCPPRSAGHPELHSRRDHSRRDPPDGG